MRDVWAELTGGAEGAGEDPGRKDEGEPDLVLLTISGVQRYIRESRSTSDLGAASRIVAELSAVAAQRFLDHGARLVMPAESSLADSAGVPNKIVALAPAGTGGRLARAVAEAVREKWRGWVRTVMGREVETPGMPGVQWVCSPASEGGYARQWAVAQQALPARRRVRDFPAVEAPQRVLCSLSPRWPAEVEEPPHRAPRHERDALSAANWVKRLWRHRVMKNSDGRPAPGFPSTGAVASAPFRHRVLESWHDAGVVAEVGRLRRAVKVMDRFPETPVKALGTLAESGEGGPGDGSRKDARWFAEAGGRWVFPDTWRVDRLRREFPEVEQERLEEAVREGHRAATRLITRMRDRHGAAPPAPYLAVLVQDLDSLGRYLGGERGTARAAIEVSAERHRQVSERLSGLGAELREGLARVDLLGAPVYAGGDDLLAFVPASRALAAARRCHDTVPSDLPTASTAVVFFHHVSSLQEAVTHAQELLTEAKASAESKHGFAVGYVRRSGVREASLQGWAGAEGERGPEADFALFLRPATGTTADGGGAERVGLSPRIVGVLARDADELSSLPAELYAAEIRRLVTRHGGSAAEAEALLRLGRGERPETPGSRAPVAAARVAAFLRGEAR
ncbi:type III-B CRISPR-associated protein Cas10/Cmr2 [Streptomyces calidiresistens]